MCTPMGVAMLQTSLLLMKSLSKTKTLIFVMTAKASRSNIGITFRQWRWHKHCSWRQ